MPSIAARCGLLNFASERISTHWQDSCRFLSIVRPLGAIPSRNAFGPAGGSHAIQRYDYHLLPPALGFCLSKAPATAIAACGAQRCIFYRGAGAFGGTE